MHRTARLAGLLPVLAVACTVDARAPFSAGNGLKVDEQTGALSVDTNRVPDVPQCTEGHLLSRTAAGWSCVPPPDPDVPPASGGGLSVDGTGLRVDPANVPVVSSCAEGELVARSGSGWSCVPEVTVPAPLVAGSGLSIVEGVISPDPSKVPLLGTCATGELVARSGAGWTCVPGPMVPRVLGPLSLAAGDCVSVRHDLHSSSVVPTIFRRAVNASRWVQDVLGYQAGGVNVLSLSDKVAQTTGGLVGSVVANALDVSPGTAWYGGVGATFTVDLGARYSLDQVAVQVGTTEGPDQTSDVEFQVSLDGVSFTSLVRKQVPCGQTNPAALPQGAEARHIRIVGHAAQNCPAGTPATRTTIAGITVVTTTPATAYRIVDDDTIELCNRFDTRLDWVVIPQLLAAP